MSETGRVSSADDEPKGPFNLVMHPDDVITLMTLAAGMQPTILVKVIEDDSQEDGCRVDIETWGLPQDPSELAEFFAGAAEALTEEIERRENPDA